MRESTDIRIDDDNEGIFVLEVIKKRNTMLIGETTNMHRNVTLILSAIPTLIDVLKTLLSETATLVRYVVKTFRPARWYSLKSVLLADERFAHLSDASNDCSSDRWRAGTSPSEVRSLSREGGDNL